jgi:hypothetical protein
MLVKVPKYATRYLSKTIDIDPPNSIDEAKEQIKQIVALERCRYIGCDEAKEQIERLQSYIVCEQATDHEARLRALEARELPVVGITVEGGLPTMPGCEATIMPPRTLAVKQDEDPPKGVNPWSGDNQVKFAAHDNRLRVLEARAERTTVKIKISDPLEGAAAAGPAPTETMSEGGVHGYASASFAGLDATSDAETSSKWLENDPNVQRQRRAQERLERWAEVHKGLKVTS